MNLKPKTILYDGSITKPRRKSLRGPGRPTREQAEQRNEELLDRTFELFLERGFEGSSIEAITDSIGMSNRTVYARYGDKLTLFKAALQRAIDAWDLPLKALQAGKDEELGDVLLRIARLLTESLRNSPGMQLFKVAQSEAFRTPEIATYLWERTARIIVPKVAEIFLNRLWPDNLQRAQDAALAFLILTVEGSVQMLAWGDIPEDEFDRQTVFRTHIFLRGIENFD